MSASRLSSAIEAFGDLAAERLAGSASGNSASGGVQGAAALEPYLKRRRGRPLARQGRFGQWLARSGLDRCAVAGELGVSRRHLDNLAREDRRPSLELAIKIERLTGGEITAAFLSSLRRRS